MTIDMAIDRRAWTITAIVAVVIAVLAGLVASSGEVPGWEESIFHAINDLPDWLEGPMWVFQLAGLLLVPLVVAAVAAAFKRWWLALALVLFVPLKLLVEKGVVKQLVERERPGTTICGYDAADPTAFDPDCGNFRGDVPLDGLSFVSGHAIIAWGVAALLWPVLPGRWRWVPVVVASLNAVARVYLGAHNPLDVIGGGAIGVAIAAVLLLAIDLIRSRSTQPSQQKATLT
ncbi:MAG TPA: phosphatase PAP2 family protein [Ilumatobacteraceae bacterium]|jgi:membrane-associated phospholipid phosphatase|nr:phosphatase PAP2 family protein [Ilumatobacteraceae bacterium]